MTEPGAEPRARGAMDDTLYTVHRTGFADFTYTRLCTRVELWAAIEDYRNAPRPYAAEAAAVVRALLGMEAE